MLTCPCKANQEFLEYFNRLQYGLKDRCKDHIRLVKLAQILTYMESISSEDCSKNLKCFYEELKCN